MLFPRKGGPVVSDLWVESLWFSMGASEKVAHPRLEHETTHVGASPKLGVPGFSCRGFRV